VPLEGSLYLLGMLVAATGGRWPATIVLLMAPSALVYRALRDGVAARLQYRRAVLDFADELDARDPNFRGHSRRVAGIAREVALRLGLPADDAELVYLAARVHNVGLVAVKATALSKGAPLTKAEWAEMRAHPQIGVRLIGRFPEFAGAAALVEAHHERWDGRGYPHGLRGEAIPLGARVIAAVDAFVAMTSNRAYRPALTPETVRSEFLTERGSQFDPRVIDALFAVLNHHPEYVHRPEVTGQGTRVAV
jgi:HD-GYP domain-containing protein (c-di-GMP phosphodiesterase class II)